MTVLPSLTPMRTLSLLTLTLVFLSGCSGTGFDPYGGSRSSRSYPASARTSSNGQERYRVCHKGKNDLVLPSSAVDAHIGHGDRFGACSRNDRQDDRRDDRQDDRRDDRRGRGNGRGRG